MGTWRIESGLYGEQERWVPDFHGEWPQGVGDPCAVCVGELIRRTVYPTSGREWFAYHRERAKYEAIKRSGRDAVEPQPPTPAGFTHYEVRCYRGPHGLSRPGPDGRSSGPTLVGTLPTLSRPLRTRDWASGEEG